jgi:hypothetical protein
MNNNASYYAIFIYIFIIIFLFISKPDIIYDRNNKKFKDFGIGPSKSLISLHILAILIPIIIYILFSFIFNNHEQKQIQQNIGYPINYYYTPMMPPNMQPMMPPNMNFQMPNMCNLINDGK